MRLMPREERFFDLFAQLAEITHQAARALEEMLRVFEDVETRAEKIRDFEHQGDDVVHEIMNKLDKTFITPLDREDIHALSSRLDDVLDLVEAAANKTVLYRITTQLPEAVALSKIIVQCAERIHTAVSALEKNDGVLKHCIELNRLEEEGDRISRKAIAALFEHESNPINLLKHKELFEILESCIDRCEDVANILETITLKNA